MNTATLYNKLIDDRRLSASDKSLLLDIDYLSGLSGSQLDATKVKETVCCYFPQGRIRVAEIQTFSAPPQGERIKLSGRGNSLPFTGMAVNLEIWAEELTSGQFELRVTIRAHGAGADGIWTIAQGFPFYRNSLLGEVRFAVSGDPQFPLLTLTSHEVPAQGILSGMYCKGLLEADSIQGANPRLFLGAEAGGKYIAAFGTITAFLPEDSDQETIHPAVSLFGGLPQRPEGMKLGGLFSVENIQYSLKASPSFSTATRDWESSCALVWVADLVITPQASSTGQEHPNYRIPIGVEVYQKDGAIRFWSDLREGLSLAWDVMANSVPGTALRIPASEFQLKDLVKLTEFELLADRDDNGELSLEWVSLSIETNEENNRWTLIDRLLTLDAIDFDILIRNPTTNPGVNFSLSGLFGVGKEGVLRLTTELDHSTQGTDYSFSGQLISGTRINIKEILSHFLGHSRYQDLPEMEVRDFSFSAQPKSKVYEGEILLHGDWSIPSLSSLSLQGVFFRLRHEGEGDTVFQAFGSFELGGVRLFVSADYVSDGHGWTFAGGVYEQEKIPIGDWLDDIIRIFGLGANIQLPAPVQGLEVSGLGARFNTATKDFSFHGTAEFPVDGKKDGASKAKLTVQVDLEHKPDQTLHALTFSGSLQLFEREFAVKYGSQGNTSLLVAAYDGAKVDQIEFKDFVGQISQDVAAVIPRGVKIDLKRAQLAFGKIGATSKFLFGVELGAGIQLSNLPLVGQLFDRSQTLSVVLQILAANADFEADEVKQINQLTASGATKLPENRISVSQRNVHLQASVQFSGFSQQLDLPLETNVESSTAATSPGIVSTAPKDEKSVKWFNIQKAIGPFHFQRFGIGLRAGNIEFLLDASLMTAGLTIALQGLAAECALTELSKGNFQPTFHLDGLGVDFKRGDLEIGGALSRNPTADPGQYQYDGAVVINYKKLGIQAIGSYRTFDGRPSLFIYALINYPIGGPSFFFVEGLALGFGYNRSLTVPTLDEIPQFPLVAQAISPPNPPPNLTQMASDMGRRLTPTVGEYFLAVGVKFSSFKTIEGFVLLTVLFGEHFEIDVLGVATLSSPPRQMGTGQPPLMTARLALLARYLPENGVLMVMAKLMPDAHVFSPDCHITGGFAFYCWFDKEHKGDFVLTLGGYHKSFQAPAHYPQVPRLGLNWQVNSNLSVKADAYFALTPSAVMAGGHLQVNWQSGNLRAWFNAGVDFLIGWQPYHYDGEVKVSIGASYSFEFFGRRTVSVELTADLTIWGPPFSGTAHVQWYIISFDIAFGNPRSQSPEALKWEAFRKSFLPENKDVCTIAAQAGKVANQGSQGNGANGAAGNQSKHLGVINPRQLSIAVNSAIPIKEFLGVKLAPPTSPPKVETAPILGIAPMNKKQGNWNSQLTITVERNGVNVGNQFQATPLRQSVPVALWDEEIDPKKRNTRLIENAICGYEIKPVNPVSHTAPKSVSTSLNQHDLALPSGRAQLWEITPEHDQRNSGAVIRNNVQRPDVRQARQVLLEDLSLETETDWSGVTVAAWRANPLIVQTSLGNVITDETEADK